MSLEQARERRDAARRDVVNGLDPTLRRIREKICLADTFEAVARMKMRALHIVPQRPMSGCCITAALREMGFAATEMSWHRFRSLASTQLHELGWNERWIETQLSRTDCNKAGRSYNHMKYLPQRRTMMQTWAD